MIDRQKHQCLSNLIKAAQDFLDCDLTGVQRHLGEHIRDIAMGMEEDIDDLAVEDKDTRLDIDFEQLVKEEGDEDEETHEG